VTIVCTASQQDISTHFAVNDTQEDPRWPSLSCRLIKPQTCYL